MEVLYFLEAFPIGYWVDEDQTVGPDRSTSHSLFVSWLKKKNGEDYKGICYGVLVKSLKQLVTSNAKKKAFVFLMRFFKSG